MPIIQNIKQFVKWWVPFGIMEIRRKKTAELANLALSVKFGELLDEKNAWKKETA